MKRITIITGHYGSGKSEVAINLAIHKNIKYLVDLDIVNPYFRSRELAKMLEETGINLISSPVSSFIGSDLPYTDWKAYSIFKDKDSAIYDLGGDKVGAKILKQFLDLVDFSEVDLLMCINVFREKTNSKEKIIKMIEEIQLESNFKVTGLINNSNLLRETSLADIKFGEEIINEVSKFLNLKIVYTTISEKLVNPSINFLGEIIPLKLYLRKTWL